jgi:hypothetical protein
VAGAFEIVVCALELLEADRCQSQLSRGVDQTSGPRPDSALAARALVRILQRRVQFALRKMLRAERLMC